ncbi:MAG: hypothetical protein ACYCXT_03855 [Acidiferrobacteraceae bacterium]
MKKMFRIVAAALATAPVIACASTTVGVMPSYFEGTFGTPNTTRIWYVPTYLDYRSNTYGFKITVPYLQVQSQGAVFSGGTVVGSRGGRGVTTSSGAGTTAGGLGDIWLKGTYTLHGRNGMEFLPYAKIKLGTASVSQGLGTGQDDAEGGIEADWVLGPRTFPFASIGYRFVGSTIAYPLQNILTYQAGSSFGLGGQRFLTALFTGHQSEQVGFPASADAVVAWNYSPRRGPGFETYFDKGLTSGSPNYGVGVGVQDRF